MFAISRPEIRALLHRGRSNEGVSKLHAVAFVILPEEFAGLLSDSSIDWNAHQSREQASNDRAFPETSAVPHLRD